MKTLNLFPTNIFIDYLSLDLKTLEKEIIEYSQKQESVCISNIGGYQGHGYFNKTLFHYIAKNLPTNLDKPLKEITSNMWININKTGDYNGMHDHNPYQGTALSGVFYVKTPKNCGRIKLYDPRQFVTNAPDMAYYNNSNTFHYFDPEPNMLLIFPGWLKHLVEPNQSSEPRISIAFNIKLIY